ncbi:uncharacterized protein LOC132734118 [Ruditapes philippinarum]|uniref:uncharacterized protein LOC132734118 n=1 Tax=Ruditapes philippinarum TaxID=129788 RepID=UPI00295C1E0D|nr:uncharacterized protein LOC132734118 [Ruditapes philippinarum]
MKESDLEIYAVLKMTVNPQTGCCDYPSAMRFWRAVETKYQERKRRWLEAKARMMTAKMAAFKAQRELDELERDSEDQTCETSRSVSPMSDLDFEDARDDEFSDVDDDMFVDPADRYYTSLDADEWQSIRHNLMRAHRYEFDRKKRIIRRVLVVILSLFWILVGGILFFLKTTEMTTEHEPVIEQTTKAECLFQCDQKTMIHEFIQMLFTSARTDEEI